MPKTTTFRFKTFRFTDDDLRHLAMLALHHQRNKGETLRLLITEAHNELMRPGRDRALLAERIRVNAAAILGQQKPRRSSSKKPRSASSSPAKRRSTSSTAKRSRS